MKAISREQLRDLPASKRMLILIACCLYLAFAWSSVGAISAVTLPILKQYNAKQFFSLTTVCAEFRYFYTHSVRINLNDWDLFEWPVRYC